jgi:hypothetical protein
MIRVCSCDFVDRFDARQKPIHEATRSNTKQHENQEAARNRIGKEAMTNEKWKMENGKFACCVPCPASCSCLLPPPLFADWAPRQ